MVIEGRTPIHSFKTSGEAYDACQCDPRIESGDILLIRSEQIVGLAWTWPVAVTLKNGAMHIPFPAPQGDLEKVRKDAKWSLQNVMDAVSVASGEGWEVNPFFTHFDVGGEK